MARPVTLVIGFLFIVISVLAQHAVHSCGERVLQRRGLLIGGKYSTRGMWPWQVGIYKNLNGWTFICSGALVAPQWVLTAAHCFYAERNNPIKTRFKKDIKPVTKYKVRAGDHEIKINEDSEQERFPLDILVHPGYRHDPNYENDIALIKLDQNVTLGDYVRTVCLPDTTQDLTMPGAVGTIAGWGMTESSWRSSSLLHSRYTILNNSACDKSSKHFFNQTVTFCARDIKQGVACYGDSGGSMVRKAVVHGQLHRWTTIGLVSWGGCTLKNNYVYYTKLQPFMDWILNITNLLCKDLGPPHHGLRLPVKRYYKHSDVVVFQCIAGYTRMGMYALSCQPDGTWNGYKPLCLGPCSDPGVPQNGVRFGRNVFNHGQTVTFRCHQGYLLVGDASITCNNGRWTNKRPSCSGPCNDPGVPQNGVRLRRNDFKHGRTVTFRCNQRYVLVGDASITCNNGRWTSKRPSCSGPCSDPGVPQNAIRLGPNDFKHGQTVTFRCKKRYVLVGDSSIACNNGRWTSKRPSCSGPCNDPGVPQNGVRLGPNDFKHGQTVTFRCNQRYVLVGDASITCNNGRWTSKRPSCSGPCNDPGVPQNGVRLGPNDFKHGQTVTFRCNQRYVLVGDASITCNNGRWDKSRPRCTGPCSDPGVPQNAVRLGPNDFKHGQTVTFRCNQRYVLVGDASITCNNGRWTNKRPSCSGPCSDPGVPQNGVRLGLNDFKHGQTVTFRCNQRYVLVGDASITCNNGRWDKSRPRCTDGLQNMIGNMQCKDGYHVNGTLTFTQHSTLRVPNCKSGNRRCPRIPTSKWSDLRDYYPHGYIKSLHCRSHKHKLHGPPYTRCQDGTWSNIEATCQNISLSVKRSGVGCGKYYVTKNPPSGHIMSPGYPQEYTHKKKCSWQIKSNTRIGLYFKTFETEANYDFVKVYDGESASSPLIGSYSGSTIPPYITSTFYVLYITFTSDFSRTKKGFAAHFEAIDSGSLRLVGGTSRSGRVEIFYHKEWGTVCDDSWDVTDSNVACKQLGFPRAIAAHSSAKYGQGVGNIWIDDIVCKGIEGHLLRCSGIKVNPWRSHNCDHSKDAGVECQKRVRLVNGGDSYGRVEVYHEGQWGTVCDAQWDIKDANVICKELGFSRASNAYTGAYYGQGSGPIWMDEVACLGSEDSLVSCGFRGWINDNYSDCSHSEDAGVKCV